MNTSPIRAILGRVAHKYVSLTADDRLLRGEIILTKKPKATINNEFAPIPSHLSFEP